MSTICKQTVPSRLRDVTPCGLMLLMRLNCYYERMGPITSIINLAFDVFNLASSNSYKAVDIMNKFYDMKIAVRPYLSGIDTTLFVTPRNGRSILDIMKYVNLKTTPDEALRASIQVAVLLSWGSLLEKEQADSKRKFCF